MVPRPATKWVIDGQVGEDLGAGGRVVGARVGRVAVLVEHHPVGVLGGELLGDAGRPSLEPPAAGEEMISAPHMREQLRGAPREVFSGITQTMR